MLHGPASRPRLVEPVPGESAVGVVFRPGGLRPLFGAPADTLADFSVPLSELWCRDGDRVPTRLSPDGMPWTRVLHPIWEAGTGWIATTRHGLKARPLAREPRVSLTYWDAQDVVTVHATAAWADDAPTRERVWQLYLTTPPPLGYDPGHFWPARPSDPAFGLLRLRPTRIDISGLASSPKPKLTWRPSGASSV